MDKFKICRHCEEKKLVSEFPKQQFPKIGHRDKCRSCCGAKPGRGNSGLQGNSKESKKWVRSTLFSLGLTGADY